MQSNFKRTNIECSSARECVQHSLSGWIIGSFLGFDDPLASSKSYRQDWRSLAPLDIIVEMNEKESDLSTAESLIS